MILRAQVWIRRSPEEVSRFLGDVGNVARWDRGVSGVRLAGEGAIGEGLVFETLGLPGAKGDGAERGRMAYRVAEVSEEGRSRVELISRAGNARYFRRAEWRFRVEAAPEGSAVHCEAEFKLRLRYLFLAPVFLSMGGAIRADLAHMKQVIESELESTETGQEAPAVQE